MKKIIVLLVGLMILVGFMLQSSSADNDALERKIRLLQQKAEEAEQAGREDDAREIIRVIEHLHDQREDENKEKNKDEYKSRDKDAEHAEIEKHLHETHKHLDNLINATVDAFGGKDKQRAEKLHHEVREVAHRLIELEIKTRMMHREHADHEHADHEHGDGEHGDGEHAYHGHDDHDHADHNHRDGDLGQAKERVMHLYQAAEHLKAAGGHEEAEHVLNKAKEMKERLHREMQRRQGANGERGAHNGQSLERVMHVVHELHERMAIMSKELDKAHERIGHLERLIDEDEDEDDR